MFSASPYQSTNVILVFWSVVIIHWLTSNPLVDYGDQPKALHSKTTVSADRVNHADDIRIFERI